MAEILLENPKGIPSFSPGLRRRSYPGKSPENSTTPTGLHCIRWRVMQPRWDCKTADLSPGFNHAPTQLSKPNPCDSLYPQMTQKAEIHGGDSWRKLICKSSLFGGLDCKLGSPPQTRDDSQLNLRSSAKSADSYCLVSAKVRSVSPSTHGSLHGWLCNADARGASSNRNLSPAN